MPAIVDVTAIDGLVAADDDDDVDAANIELVAIGIYIITLAPIVIVVVANK